MPVKKRLAIAEARASISDLVQEVRKGSRVKITRYDKTIAWLVPQSDGEALEECGEQLEDCRRRRAAGSR